MTEFKVGDRVEIVSNGLRGRIVEIDEGYGAYGKASIDLDSSYGTRAYSLVDIRVLENSADQTPFEQSVNRITSDISKLLIDKNKAYGDSALNPVRVFSKANRMEQLYTRLDDKLSRVQKGHEYPGDDTIRDIIGYCTLILIAREGE